MDSTPGLKTQESSETEKEKLQTVAVNRTVQRQQRRLSRLLLSHRTVQRHTRRNSRLLLLCRTVQRQTRSGYEKVETPETPDWCAPHLEHKRQLAGQFYRAS